MDSKAFKNPFGELKETRDPLHGIYDFFMLRDPPLKLSDLQISEDTHKLLSEAQIELGKLSGAGEFLPNPNLLIRPYLVKEAVSSSKIEGTQATEEDVFQYEENDKPSSNVSSHDAKEVANYILALEHGLNQIKTKPITLDLIKDMHRILLTGVRGEDKDPGEFRELQNWIGPEGCSLAESTYVPPVPYALIKLLRDFENYLHYSKLPSIVHIAIIHYYFEALHPFRDGNGRLGRAIIVLYMCQKGILSEPLLYLSSFFENRREEYYEKLLRISQHSEFDKWINFFAEGVHKKSKQALTKTRKLLNLREFYIQKVRETGHSSYALDLVDFLFHNPFISVPRAKKHLGVLYPTAKNAIEKLESAGILIEITGQKRNKKYVAKEINDVIKETEKVNDIPISERQETLGFFRK